MPQINFIAQKQDQAANHPERGCCMELVGRVCRPLARPCTRLVPTPFCKCYRATAWWAAWASTHAYFDRVVFFCIVFVGIATAVQLSYPTDEPLPHGVATFLDLTQAISLTVFTGEAVIKVIACGDQPLMYFLDPDDGNFNTFDFVIVVISIFFALDPNTDGSSVAVGRLLRLVRVVLKIPELRYVLLGFLAGLNAVAPIMLLMILIIYLYAIVGRVYFGANDPAHFGNMPFSMLTLFHVATLSGWGEVYAVNAYGCDEFDIYGSYVPANKSETVSTMFGEFPTAGCYEPSAQPIVASLFFYTFTLMTSFVVLSLFISVVSRTMFEVMDCKSFDDESIADLRRLKHQNRLISEALADPASSLRQAIDTFFAKVCTAADETEKRGYAWAHRLSTHHYFEWFVTLAIVAAAILEAISVDEVGAHADHLIANYVILSVFTAEIILKFLALARTPAA